MSTQPPPKPRGNIYHTSARCFSAPVRPTSKPRQPSHPLPVRAVWSSMMALGRFGACADLLFSCGVRASSVHISHPHPSLSRERVLGRLLAVYACAFLVCAGCAKGAQGRPEKDELSTRVAARMPSEAPRLPVSSRGSHNILKFLAPHAAVMVCGWPPWALSRKCWALCMALGLHVRV